MDRARERGKGVSKRARVEGFMICLVDGPGEGREGGGHLSTKVRSCLVA